VDNSGSPRRGGWRILLGVEDDAAMQRALLSAGRERRDAGASVIVACFEPPRTDAAGLDGMPVLPLLSTSAGSERVALQAIRERRPDVVLLDDLARLVEHDDERVPQVDAIRSLGIDVISTIRAREITSLARALSPSSRASSTVPDRALLEVDDVEVVAGDSRADLVEQARQWAERPRPEGEPGGGAQDHPWSGRVVVAFDAARDADDIITRAADLARVTGAHLVGANVRTVTDDPEDPGLHDRRRLLEALDADVVEVVDDDPGWALARVAEAEGAQLVVQRGTVEGQLVLDVPTAGVRGLDLYVVAPSAGHTDEPSATAGTGGNSRSIRLPRARRAAGYIAAAFGLPLLTLVLAALRDSVDLSTVLLLYLAMTVAVTAVGGLGPGLLAAVGGFVLGDYFFTRPHFQWVIDDPNVIIAMIVFAVVAVTVSVLVDIAARRSADAARARAEATALGHLATAVLASTDPLPRLLHDLRAVFDLDAVAILLRDDDGWVVEHAVGGPVPERPADATDALAIGPRRYLALVGPRTPAEDSRVLAAFTAQLALTSNRRAVGEPT
jgi:two-component system sensor histidine kinase KdpD